MKTLVATKSTNNIIPLAATKPKRVSHQPLLKQRFRVIAHINRSGSQSYRVTGIKRDGTRVRENHFDPDFAKQRQVGLESEYHSRCDGGPVQRATTLTDVQLRVAEAALKRLDDDDALLTAVDYWLKHGRQHAVSESPRLDDALKKFNEWLDSKDCDLRAHSKKGLRLRVKNFVNSVNNFRVNDVTPEVIEVFLENLTNISPTTKDNCRRAVSRFFSWCISRPRRWMTVNPCREIKIAQGEKAPPAILSVNDCQELLKAAESNGLAPYVSVCLFAGLRPFETSRLDWKAVNLKDREIRLEGVQTKTGRPRVVAICDTLHAWLKAHEDEPFFLTNWRKEFDKVKAAAGFSGRLGDSDEKLKPWTPDVMRHTAISHYFRKTGSYGLTAEQFGNSEAIIKAHYQGRVSSDDAKAFYALCPMKGERE